MNKLKASIYLILALVISVGCSPLEIARSVWGSSTRRLDLERANAVRHTFNCSYDNCFNAVLALERGPAKSTTDESDDADDSAGSGAPDMMAIIEDKGRDDFDSFSGAKIQQGFEVFLKNRKKGVIVVLKVPGNVDTTEVGIFFSRVTNNQTTIEVSSLSTSAKLKVAEYINENLSKAYP